MSTHVFGVAERQRATGRVSWEVRALAVLLPACIALAALVWWNGLLDPHEVIKAMVLCIGGAMLAVLHGLALWRQQNAVRPLPWILLGLLDLLVLSAAVSAFLAPSTILAWFGVGGSVSGSVSMTLVAAIVFVVAASLRVAEWRPNWSWASVTYLFVLVLGVVQRLGWVDLSPGGGAARLFSPLGNETMVAWASVMMVAVALSVRELPWSRWVVIGAGFAWLAWVDRTETWLVLILALFASQLLHMFHRSRVQGVFWALPGRIALAIAVVALFLPVPRSAALPTLITANWQQSAMVIKAAWSEAPLFGVGQGQWSSIFERIRPIEANLGPLFALRFDVGANWWFTSAAQEGVIGLGVRLLLIALICLHVLRLAIRDQDRIIDVILVVVGVGVLTAIQPYTWCIVAVFALLGYASGDEYEWSIPLRRAAGVGMMVIGVGTALLLVWQVPRVLADASAQKGVTETRPEVRVDALARAVQFAPWVTDYVVAETQARVQLIATQLQDASTTNDILQASFARGIERAKAGTETWPASADMWMARGALYLAIAPATQGADQFAIQAYQEGMKYAPQHPGLPLGIATVYLHRAEATALSETSASTTKALAEYRLEQRRLAAQWLQRALEKKPDDQGILYAYATNLARAGDVASALPLFQTLVERQPNRLDLGLEYATMLAFSKRYTEAVPFAQRISSSDPLFATSRRLLTDWYAATGDWANALGAWKALPASEQSDPAFRTRLRELQSKASTTIKR